MGRSRSSKKCTIAGCGRTHRALGYCNLHYKQQRRGALGAADRPPMLNALGERRCYSCERYQALARFPPSKVSPDGRSSPCYDCKRVMRYGLTWSEYESLLQSQGGTCAICNRHCPRNPNLSVDHDHACCPTKGKSCGKCVRGLLCDDCNVGIGKMNDSPRRLLAAVAYLKGET